MSARVIVVIGVGIALAGVLAALVIHAGWARLVGTVLIVVAVVVEVFAISALSSPNEAASGPTTVPTTAPSPSPSGTAPATTPATTPVSSLPPIQVRVITSIHPGLEPPVKPTLLKEYVRLANPWSHPIHLAGWTLSNGSLTYHFPSMTVPAGGALSVRTGPGINTPTVLHWNLTQYVWPKLSGVATLRRGNGTVIQRCSYERHPPDTAADC
jgi:hypothetical protein